MIFIYLFIYFSIFMKSWDSISWLWSRTMPEVSIPATSDFFPLLFLSFSCKSFLCFWLSRAYFSSPVAMYIETCLKAFLKQRPWHFYRAFLHYTCTLDVFLLNKTNNKQANTESLYFFLNFALGIVSILFSFLVDFLSIWTWNSNVSFKQLFAKILLLYVCMIYRL